MRERIITIIQSTSALSGSLTPVFNLPLEKRPILLIQELVPGDGSEGLEEEGDWTQQRIYLVKAPDCPHASVNLSTTVSTAVSKRPEY